MSGDLLDSGDYESALAVATRLVDEGGSADRAVLDGGRAYWTKMATDLIGSLLFVSWCDGGDLDQVKHWVQSGNSNLVEHCSQVRAVLDETFQSNNAAVDGVKALETLVDVWEAPGPTRGSIFATAATALSPMHWSRD